MSDVECPYCAKGLIIDYGDGYGCEESKNYEQDCYHCGKTFAYTTTIAFYHKACKAPCLNGGEHEWNEMHIYPRCWPDSKRCANCGKEDRGKAVEWVL